MKTTEQIADDIVQMLQNIGLSFDDQIQVIRIAREILEARKLNKIQKEDKPTKVIDEIREKMQSAIEQKAKAITLMVSKDIERLMFLDDSFPKSENFLDTITVDGNELDFIVIEGKMRIEIIAKFN